MSSDKNKFNDPTHNANNPSPNANKASGSSQNPNQQNMGNTGSEPPKDNKSDTKEQVGKFVDNLKPMADKAWAVTKDLADFIKEKAPDVIDAAKKGLQEAKKTVEDAYTEFQKHRAEKTANDKQNTTTTTTTPNTTTTTTDQKPKDTSNNKKQL